MGISGLLPLLKSIQKPGHLRQFEGLTLGVDAYVWLHRAIHSCAVDLALGKPNKKFMQSFMHRVRMLTHFGCTPYFVFDGGPLPSKVATEARRAEKRAAHRRAGEALLRMGRTAEAHAELAKAVDVTPEMAAQAIAELRRHRIAYVVAPYEADAQLAYLERAGLVHAVVSEDSDLLVFGVKRLITKLGNFGECVELHRRDFAACREVSLVGWTDAEFRQMAILSGCDYVASCDRMGLKTAHQYLRRYRTAERVVQVLQLSPKFGVPPDYLARFRRAEQTFLHQRVFCPARQEAVMLTALAGDPPADFDFIGPHIPPAQAAAIARGDLHPVTRQPLEVPSLPPLDRPLKTPQRARPSTPTAKKPMSEGKIDSFLKPKRTPLSELDPLTCLKPSPSQQRLLAAQPRSIPSTPVRVRHVPTAPAPAAAAAAAATPASRGSSGGKRRLCEDASDAGDKAPEGTSRFFRWEEPTNRSFRSVGPKAKKPRASFQIWTDDAADADAASPATAEDRKEYPATPTAEGVKKGVTAPAVPGPLVRGSEDLLVVPDSEGEPDGEEEPSAGGGRPKLELASFRYRS